MIVKRRRDGDRIRDEDLKEPAGMEFSSKTEAAKDRTRLESTVVKSSFLWFPKKPARYSDRLD